MIRTTLPLCSIVACCVPTAAEAQKIDRATLFTAGDAGYQLCRIPGIIATKRGVLLAYCEARKTAGDWAAIDILLRRSTDGGQTWSAARQVAHRGPRVPKNPLALAQKIANENDQTANNPVAIADRDGTVHFLYCVEYARSFVMHSDDDGGHWTEPVEITAAFEELRDAYPWRVLATGPGHGIQLETGRLLVPVWLSTGTGGNAHRPSVTTTIFSDDHGKSWHAGDVAVPNTEEFVFPNETTAVELADGRVMLNVRSESRANRRLITTSPDGAGNWSPPQFQQDLLEPICEGSIVRLSRKPASDRNRLLFANPDTLDPLPSRKAEPGKSRTRKNLSVKLSYDEGDTWPVSKTLESGFSGYSDLAVGPDGTIYCLYESASTDGSIYHTGRLVLARFNLEWLTDGADQLNK